MKYLALFLLLPTLAAQTPTEKLLLEKIAQLEQRIAALEAKSMTPVATSTAAPAPDPAPTTPSSTSVNFYLDGYFGSNFNRPASGTNELRAFDVSHNSFTLSQGTMVVEKTASLADKRYLGARLDLQFGQATNTLQGSPANEPRPGIYRNIFQAYGTVVAPIGKGVTIDMGKFASSLGLETNYTKDQMNYSRSYYFNYLPFYHMGLRATYPVASKINATYWLVNGANQTEDFNGFKSQAMILNFNPSSAVTGNFNYYSGRETVLGRLHIFDTYWTWNANSKLTLAGELDYVRQGPGRVKGGVAYARYRFTPKWSIASRFGALNDKGGLFSGASQNLREVTLTSTFEMAEGFQMRWEYRRDMSNNPYFSTNRPGELKQNMDTALLGLIWWFGGKQGAW